MVECMMYMYVQRAYIPISIGSLDREGPIFEARLFQNLDCSSTNSL